MYENGRHTENSKITKNFCPCYPVGTAQDDMGQ